MSRIETREGYNWGDPILTSYFGKIDEHDERVDKFGDDKGVELAGVDRYKIIRNSEPVAWTKGRSFMAYPAMHTEGVVQCIKFYLIYNMVKGMDDWMYIAERVSDPTEAIERAIGVAQKKKAFAVARKKDYHGLISSVRIFTQLYREPITRQMANDQGHCLSGVTKWFAYHGHAMEDVIAPDYYRSLIGNEDGATMVMYGLWQDSLLV